VSEAIRSLRLPSCSVAGLLRGCYLSDTEDHRNVGVMMWPTQRVTAGPSLVQLGGPGFTYGRRWPPDNDEGCD
jgi:hypothetical protein